jgi:hypothetical protein
MKHLEKVPSIFGVHFTSMNIPHKKKEGSYIYSYGWDDLTPIRSLQYLVTYLHLGVW